MPNLILPARFTSQPQYYAPIDGSNPLTRGLRISLPGGDLYNQPTGRSFTRNGSPLQSANKLGRTWNLVRASSQYLELTDEPILAFPFTVVVVQQWAGAATGILFEISSAGSLDYQQLYVTSAGSLRTYTSSAANSNDAASASGLVVTTRPQVLAGRVAAANARTCYIDGVQVASNATSISPVNGTRNLIGANWTGTVYGTFYGGQVALTLAWNRALTNSEIADVSRNPWQVFKKPARRFWAMDVSGGAGAVLDAAGTAQSAGTAALTTAIRFTAAGLVVATGGAGLTTGINLAGTGAAVATGSAAISTGIQFTAVGVSVASGAGVLTTGIPLAGVGAAVATGSASLDTPAVLQAAGAALATGGAGLTTGIPLAGAGAAAASGSAVITAQIVLSAAGLSQALGNAGLTTAILLAAAGSNQATGSAALNASVAALDAAGAAVASGSATITVQIRLNASGLSQALGVASLSSGIRLAGAGAAIANGAGQLTTGIPLAGVGVAVASGGASIDVEIRLTAAGLAQAIGAGALVTQISFAAAGAAVASGTASLQPDVLLAAGARVAARRRRVFRGYSHARFFSPDHPTRTFQARA